jgi:cytochrome c oxidase subunit 2
LQRCAVLLLLLAACKENNSEHAQQLIAQYGCNACHTIPGTPGHASIGPSLDGVGARATISNGKVPNTPENLARFIREPASLNPSSSMPALNMPPADAATIAEYLSTLK